MSIVLRYNDALELNLVEYGGEITPAQLKALPAYGARHPTFLRADALSVVRHDADFVGVDLAALDALFARYRKLYGAFDLQIYRRSAWICQSAAAEDYVAHWTGAHDMREALSSNVRMFKSFAEAGEWLLLGPAEVSQLERGEGFRERARFDSPRAAAR